MKRSQYRLILTGLCAAAAAAGPVLFLEERLRTDYLVSGLVAALLCWGLLMMTAAAEPRLHPGIQAVMGAGAALLSWVPVSLAAVFEVIPRILVQGLNRFDPVWLLGGLSPLAVPAAAWWLRARDGRAYLEGLVSVLFRFSVPLFGLRVAARTMGLSRQHVSLFMFTGVMFLILDWLGLGSEFPLRSSSAPGHADTT